MRLQMFNLSVMAMLCLFAACHSRNRETTKISTFEKAPPVADVEIADTIKTVDHEPFQMGNLNRKENSGGREQQVDRGANPDWDKKIIKNGDLSIEVKNFRSFSGRLRNAVKQTGGYLSQEEETASAASIESNVTIRIPVDRFDEFLQKLPGDSDKMVDKKISAEDVTSEFVDTKSRLQTKKEVRERYLDLLKQAHSIKDIIAVQNEINDIQEEMDKAAGHIAYLSHTSAYSTINLKFYQVLDASVQENPNPSFTQKLWIAVMDGWVGFSKLLLAMVSTWPLWIITGAIAVGARNWINRSRIRTASLPAREKPVK